ncbi:MAG: hypothetical protein KGJ79_12955 [Alphaproteobacteria bacterium]|nr:hypothetical protein [Alphaproteobacteria bacterium]MDE2112046.1 hypothetical protein [Alphaproteobacteria bacterium]MDE2492430.1 hypothetical protein [Alphaproteobacteria bacterium]
MMSLHLLTALLPPSALTLTSTTFDDDGVRASLDDIRETISAQIRQVKADLGGYPEVAEAIHRIVNSTIER